MLNFVTIYNPAIFHFRIPLVLTEINFHLMKNRPVKNLLMIGAGIVLLSLGSCYRKNINTTSLNYEVVPMVQSTQGNVNFKVFSYGYDPDDALERCKMDAVHAVLFKGIPGSNQEKPLIPDMDAFSKNREYFATFFGVKDSKDISTTAVSIFGRVRLLPGNANGPYRLYVGFSGDGSVNPNDRMKVDNRYKVGVAVAVNVSLLRKRLEKDGIIKGFEF